MINKRIEILSAKFEKAIVLLEQYNNKKHKSINKEIANDILQLLKKAKNTSNEEESFYEELLKTVIAKIDQIVLNTSTKKLKKTLLLVKEKLTDISSIEHPAFTKPNEKLTLKEVELKPYNGFGFRGDDRDPKQIFTLGFEPQEKDKLHNDSILIERPFESANKNVVAFSRRFTAATSFPFDDDVKRTWIYMVKPTKVFDVHQHGYEVYAKEGINSHQAQGLYVDELITDKIPVENIIIAVEIIRSPYDNLLDKKSPFLKRNPETEEEKVFIDFYNNRGLYIINSYQINDKCTLPKEDIELATNFIKAEKEANEKNVKSASRSALPTSGFFTSPTQPTEKEKQKQVELKENNKDKDKGKENDSKEEIFENPKKAQTSFWSLLGFYITGFIALYIIETYENLMGWLMLF